MWRSTRTGRKRLPADFGPAGMRRPTGAKQPAHGPGGGGRPRAADSGEAQHPPVISTEAKRVEKPGQGRAPGGRKSLRRRRSALRVSPLRLRSEPALSEAEGAGCSAPARRAGPPVEMTGWGRNEGRGGGPRAACPNRHFDRPGAPCPVISTEAEQPALSEVEGSGEIRPATGAGQAPEPLASMERPPGFSPSASLRACPERSRRGRLLRPGPRAGASVEMTGEGGERAARAG